MADTAKPAPWALVAGEQERRWLEENREAIASINAFIDRHGLIASRLRYRVRREPA
jgi:post-segregation antitoxin (ccd killing protein)